VGFAPDPWFQPFFWRGDGDDEDAHGMEGDKSNDPSKSATPDVANMQVDGHPSDGSGKTAAPFWCTDSFDSA
jgi:hypothetical protein